MNSHELHKQSTDTRDPANYIDSCSITQDVMTAAALGASALARPKTILSRALGEETIGTEMRRAALFEHFTAIESKRNLTGDDLLTAQDTIRLKELYLRALHLDAIDSNTTIQRIDEILANSLYYNFGTFYNVLRAETAKVRPKSKDIDLKDFLCRRLDMGPSIYARIRIRDKETLDPEIKRKIPRSAQILGVHTITLVERGSDQANMTDCPGVERTMCVLDRGKDAISTTNYLNALPDHIFSETFLDFAYKYGLIDRPKKPRETKDAQKYDALTAQTNLIKSHLGHSINERVLVAYAQKYAKPKSTDTEDYIEDLELRESLLKAIIKWGRGSK